MKKYNFQTRKFKVILTLLSILLHTVFWVCMATPSTHGNIEGILITWGIFSVVGGMLWYESFGGDEKYGQYHMSHNLAALIGGGTMMGISFACAIVVLLILEYF